MRVCLVDIFITKRKRMETPGRHDLNQVMGQSQTGRQPVECNKKYTEYFCRIPATDIDHHS